MDTKVLELFKQAFGENALEQLISEAADEIYNELNKKADFENYLKEKGYNDDSTISQSQPGNLEKLKEVGNQFKSNFYIKNDINKNQPNILDEMNEATRQKQVAEKTFNDIKGIEERERQKPLDITEKIMRDIKEAPPERKLTNEEIFKEKLHNMTKEVKSHIDLKEKGYETANKLLDAAQNNPAAAVAVAGGVGLAGTLGLGMLGKGLIKALKKGKVSKEVMASISEEVMDEIIKEASIEN